MSMALYVLSDDSLPSMAAWQRAIDAGTPGLRLPSQMAMSDLNGVLSVDLNGQLAAFECRHADASTLATEFPDVDLGRPWKYALVFRWGGNVDAGVAAYCAGAAYAEATEGVLIDSEESKIISPARAIEIAGELRGSKGQIEEAVRLVLEKRRK